MVGTLPRGERTTLSTDTQGTKRAGRSQGSLGSASLRQVAEFANVSPSTVSRFVRGQLRMRADTEARVRRAMETLGYPVRALTKPVTTRAVRRTSAETIALILPEMDNAYYGIIADHVVEEAERRGLFVLLCSTRNQVLKEESYIELLTGGKVAGLLYLGSHRHNARLVDAVRRGFPVVVVDELIAGLPPVDCVIMDDYAGGYQATGHLVQLGHRRIAFVGGPTELHSVGERFRGFTDALVKVSLDARDQIRLAGPFAEQFGMNAMSHLLARQPMPTAVFGASDSIALGLLAASGTHGVQVPDELSIVGFDDLRFSEYVRPRLTTVHSPVDRLSAIGVEMLVERLEGSTVPARKEILPVSLVERNSTGAPKVTVLRRHATATSP